METCFSRVFMPIQPNILADNSGHARITDFDLATVTCDSDWTRTSSEEQYRTAQLTAPEILRDGGPLSKEADIFSLRWS